MFLFIYLSISSSQFIYLSILVSGPVSWSCRIHRLHLCRDVRLPQRVSWIWHETIWWWGSCNAWALGNRSTSSLLSLLGSLCPRGVAPERALSMGQIEQNVIMLKWILWNRTVSIREMDLGVNNLQWLICH